MVRIVATESAARFIEDVLLSITIPAGADNFMELATVLHSALTSVRSAVPELSEG